MEAITATLISESELDALVHQHLDFPKWQFVPEQEANNDSEYLYSNIHGEFSDDWKWQELIDNHKNKKYPRIGIDEVLHVLVNKGLIPAGNIIVEVYW